jgi:hypothetical protein
VLIRTMKKVAKIAGDVGTKLRERRDYVFTLPQSIYSTVLTATSLLPHAIFASPQKAVVFVIVAIDVVVRRSLKNWTTADEVRRQ